MIIQLPGSQMIRLLSALSEERLAPPPQTDSYELFQLERASPQPHCSCPCGLHKQADS